MLAHLRKERFTRGEYNKPKLNKIGPWKILRKFLAKGYGLELPKDIGISSTFNVVDLWLYKGDIAEAPEDV